MRKTLFKLFLLFISTSIFAQLPTDISDAREIANNSSKQEILNYINRAKSNGYTLSQVKSLMKAQGASFEEITSLEQFWNEPEKILEESDLADDNIQSNFGNSSRNKNPNIKKDGFFKSRRFGSSYFENQYHNEAPELYLATPSDYRLGPGDEILINLYGASEKSYELKISREGTVKLDRLAPVYLSGMPVSEAKSLLEANLSKVYSGLKSKSNDPSKVYLSLSLQKSRSVVVNITGHVKSPGTYTLSGFTSVINALFAAGGPNNIGSYRKIRLLRGGILYKEIDLYDFFVDGIVPAIYLQDQDVLQVPAFNSQVELSGAFKSPGYFEIKDNETLSDVIYFSGGFLSDAFRQRVFVNRINGFKRQFYTINITDSNSEILKDGDIITANFVRESVENFVVIEGEVYVPGSYSLESVSTVEDLILTAKGLTLSALSTKATLFRASNNVEAYAMSIDLTNKNDLEVILKNGDRLFIPSVKDLTDFGSIDVQGEVNSPGLIEFKTGMKLSDALILADGFNISANPSEVSIFRLLANGDFYSEIISVDESLVPEKNIELFVNDLVVVRRLSKFRSVEKVELKGYVKNEGFYAVKGADYRLFDLFQESGGFLEEAYLPGITITRQTFVKDSNQEVIKSAIESASGALESKSENIKLKKDEKSEQIIIPINGEKLVNSRGLDPKYNLVLMEGDIIKVPKLDNTITVLGEIQRDIKISYQKSISVKSAIRSAGGLSSNARKSKVYVVYQNGSIKSRRSFLFGLITKDPRLLPGSTVFVPQKPVYKGESVLGNIVGYTSTLATLALLIKQLGN